MDIKLKISVRKETEQSWEKDISIILNVNEDNLLREFITTVNLENKNLYEEYKDKVLYHALDRFIQDKLL